MPPGDGPNRRSTNTGMKRTGALEMMRLTVAKIDADPSLFQLGMENLTRWRHQRGGRPAEMVQAVGGVVRTRRAVEAHPRPTPRRLRRGAAPAHEPPLRGRAHAGRARVGLRLRLRRAQGRVRAAHRTPVADHARDGHRAVRMAGRRSAGTARVVVEDTDERPVEQRGRGAQETAQGRPARAPDRHARAQPRDGLRDATGATWPLETAVPNRRKH